MFLERVSLHSFGYSFICKSKAIHVRFDKAGLTTRQSTRLHDMILLIPVLFNTGLKKFFLLRPIEMFSYMQTPQNVQTA